MIVFQEKVSTFSTFNSSLPPREKSPGSRPHLPLLSHLPPRPASPLTLTAIIPRAQHGMPAAKTALLRFSVLLHLHHLLSHNLLLPGNTYSAFTILLRQHHLRETLATWGWCPCSVLSLYTHSLTQRLLN